MDSFEFNKIAGAVLGTALGVMALSIVSEIIFAPAEAERPGMEVAAGPEGGYQAGNPPPATDVAPIAVRLASADVEAGKSSAKKCQACHTFGQGEPGKVGPNLWNVVGGPAAHMDGFKYSAAMLKAKADGLTWTFDDLDHFIAAPKSLVPGTAMGFAGIKKADERANVIAYLRTLSDSPVPLPTADAAPAAGEAPAPAAPAEPAPAAPAPAEPPAPVPPPAPADQAPAAETPPPAQ